MSSIERQNASVEPSFGVVILNWNNAADTVQCLDQLVQCDPRPARVIVVDNGSRDDSVDAIGAWWSRAKEPGRVSASWLELIQAPTNLGFAGGSNLGIRELLDDSSVSHILLLNNDTVIPPDFFAELEQALKEAAGAGIIGPTIREFPATEKIWYAGAREYFFRGLVQHSVSAPSGSTPRKTDFVTGCAMLVSRPVFETVGELAEVYYPAYFEDGDLCHRALKAGFSVVYAPRPLIFHKVGSTVRAADLDLELAYAKNRLRVIYVRRNYTGLNRIIALSYLAATKPLRTVVEIAKGQPQYAWQVLRGTVSGFLARDIA